MPTNRPWVVERVEGLDSERALGYRVRRAGAEQADAVIVWWYPTHGPRCTACSGPLRAMLASCAHARAVKRTVTRLVRETLT